jgi:hypothetical protein
MARGVLVVLDRPHRLLRGSAPEVGKLDSLPSEGVIRGRIRRLIQAALLPRLSPDYIGTQTSQDGRTCVAVSSSSVILYLHRRCLELWADEG